MRVGLLECDHVPGQFRHIAGDYRDMYAQWLRDVAPALHLQPFDICHGELPDSTNACDAYICTGSRSSVFDNMPWVRALQAFVRQLQTARRPLVGVCFGHQLLAEALGGKAERAPGGWGVGVHRMEILRREPWMQPTTARCALQFMHQDQVTRLPRGGVVLGRSDHCPMGMFRVGDTMLGIQAHPEFSRAYHHALLIERAPLVGLERAKAGQKSLDQPTDERVIATWIVAFLGQAGRTERGKQDHATSRSDAKNAER